MTFMLLFLNHKNKYKHSKKMIKELLKGSMTKGVEGGGRGRGI
jgi:hypothetical protein